MRTVMAGLVAALVLGAAAPALAAPTATLTPAGGPPTTSVSITGAGFTASTSVDVFFDTTDIGLAATSATGAVAVTVPVPASAAFGTHWITLDERQTHTAAQAQFFVRTNWAQDGFGPQGRRFNEYE